MTDRDQSSVAQWSPNSSPWRQERRAFRILAIGTTAFALIAVFAAHEYPSAIAYGLLAAVGCAGYLFSFGGDNGYRGGYSGGLHQGATTELARAEARERELADLLAACDLNVEDTVPDPDEGYIYVLKFSTGTVKPGQTRNLRRRFGERCPDCERAAATWKRTASPSATTGYPGLT